MNKTQVFSSYYTIINSLKRDKNLIYIMTDTGQVECDNSDKILYKVYCTLLSIKFTGTWKTRIRKIQIGSRGSSKFPHQQYTSPLMFQIIIICDLLQATSMYVTKYKCTAKQRASVHIGTNNVKNRDTFTEIQMVTTAH